MATVNKDFKIKSGLIVEGTTATVNGNQVLTENASDQYILDLIGGETLVKSVSNEFDVSVAGELSIDRATVDAYYDAAGDAADALTDANAYTDGRETAITTAYEAYADQAEVDAKAYTDTRETAITTAYQSYADTAETDAKAYTDTREGLITTAYEAYADQAESDAVTSANSYTDGRETAITTAYQSYADTAEADAVTTANAYTDTEIAALVNGAPALLDTLNELAAAIDDDPNFASTLTTLAGEKVAKAGDTMTGALTLSGAPTSDLHASTKKYVDDNTYLADMSARGYADGLAVNYDASGAAATAEANANSYTDGEITDALVTAQGYASTAQDNAQTFATNAINALDSDDIEEGVNNLYYTDARARSEAINLLTNATKTNITIDFLAPDTLSIAAENGVADSTTDDLDEGALNFYFTDERAVDAIGGSNIQPLSIDINTYRKEEATQQYVASASTVTAHAFTGNKSVKYLVRTVGNVTGTLHSQVTEILLTVDGGGNIAMTEYGTIYTSESPLATFSADSLPTGLKLLTATTAVAGCEVIVAATLLSWAD